MSPTNSILFFCLTSASDIVAGFIPLGSFITHAEGTFVYFLVEDLAILLFRTIPAAASKTSLLDTPKLKV